MTKNEARHADTAFQQQQQQHRRRRIITLCESFGIINHQCTYATSRCRYASLLLHLLLAVSSGSSGGGLRGCTPNRHTAIFVHEKYASHQQSKATIANQEQGGRRERRELPLPPIPGSATASSTGDGGVCTRVKVERCAEIEHQFID